MKYQIITELYNSKELDRFIKKIKPAVYQDDLKQYLSVVLLEKDEATIVRLHKEKKLMAYAVCALKNMSASNTSPFYKLYREFDKITDEYLEQDFDEPAYEQDFADLPYCENIEEKEPIQNQSKSLQPLWRILCTELQNTVMAELEKEHYFDFLLISDYIEKKGSVDKIIKAQKENLGCYIPERALYDGIKRVKEWVRTKSEKYKPA